jgi:hypothetical protein
MQIVTPDRDHVIFSQIAQKHNIRLHEYSLTTTKGMLHSEIMLCRADEICPDVDYVFLLDSDCVAQQPFIPQDYFIDGKPIIIGQKFSNMIGTPAERQWRPAVKAALGIDPKYETMTRHPSIFHIGLFKPFREAVEKHTKKPFDQYVLSCRDEYPQTFAELTSLGNFALQNFPDLYYLADMQDSSGPHNIQR